MLQSCGNIPYDPPLIEDGLTNEWTDEIMQLFEQKCNYCLAAETKKRELIAQGVKEEQIVFCRIDGGREFKELWAQWMSFDGILEMHIYSHGDYGKPEVYHGTLDWSCDDIGYISSASKWDTEHSYPALNFTSNAKIYLYGCHTASDSRSKVLAFIQGATVYANRYSASFSMEKDFRKYVSDDAYGKDVYLYSYAMDLVNKPTADTGELIFAYKIPEIALTLVNAPLDIRLSAPKRVPMVVYYPEE